MALTAKQSNAIEKQSNNQKGGRRPGAGRKKGEPNKRTAEAQEQAEATGVTPLEFLLNVMRTNEDPRVALSAAVAAAPYVHAKLANIQLTGKGGEALKFERIERTIIDPKK